MRCVLYAYERAGRAPDITGGVRDLICGGNGGTGGANDRTDSGASDMADNAHE